MEMHFKSPGKKFFAERKPWRPDTKRFDYWKGVAEKHYTERREKLWSEIENYTENKKPMSNLFTLRYLFASLSNKHKELLRSKIKLWENKDFAEYCSEVKAVNPKFKIVFDEKGDPDINRDFLVPDKLDSTLAITFECGKKLYRYDGARNILRIEQKGFHERLTFINQMLGYVSICIEMPDHAIEKGYFATPDPLSEKVLISDPS